MAGGSDDLQHDPSRPFQRKLSPQMAASAQIERLQLDEKRFRWLLNEDAMATEKLSEGIRIFNADAVKLKEYIRQRMGT